MARATEEDSLGFKPYVTAIAEFLTNPVTKPPLTLSIEGKCGSGKSSFMRQLEKAIEEVSQKNYKQELKELKELKKYFDKCNAKKLLCKLLNLPRLISIFKKGLSIYFTKSKYPRIVCFEPWKYNKAEALWAAFALEFLRQISQIRQRRDIFRVLQGNVKLFFLRFDWKNGFQTISSVLVGLLILVVLAILLWVKGDEVIQQFTQTLSQNQQNRTTLQGILKLTVLCTSVIGFISLVLKLLNLGNPKNDLTKYLRAPNYQNQVTFLENFHEDFRKIVEAFAGKDNKVYVFIDDLDRCEAPKSAELMQAIKMMISNDPQLIFILGMDRDKVAQGLAIKHKQLIPYLELEEENKVKRSSSVKGIDYAYTCMEKFIQLPFQVPKSNEENFYQIFLRQISSSSPESQSNKAAQDTLSSSSIEHQKIQQRIELIKECVTDELIYKIASMVSSALDCSPRRVKQFINLFRLKAFIAASIGFFEVQSGCSKKERLMLVQLGKFTAIALKWPRLLVDLRADPDLIKKLQTYAPNFNNCDSTTKHWGNHTELVKLLHYSDQQETHELDNNYSLEYIDIDKLLEVSPRVIRPKIQSEKRDI